MSGMSKAALGQPPPCLQCTSTSLLGECVGWYFRPVDVLRSRRMRLGTVLVTFLAIFLLSGAARAAPTSASTRSSASSSQGVNSSRSRQKFELPVVVVGGNAISAQLPVQFGMVGYLPKARFAFQYDRQLLRQHWIQVGVALVFDRAGFENFRMDRCGLEAVPGACGKGGVVGFDVYAGYSHKFLIKKYPFLVPIVRGNIGFTYFALPKVGGGDGDRLQSRIHSWTLNLRPGGGLRVFLFSYLALGVDVNLPIGFLIHTDRPLNGERDRSGAFLLGIEVLPLLVEYRF